MSDDRSHPNHPDYQRHDAQTGVVDEDVTGQEILDPISVGALATLQRVEIDQQVATAKAYPRNVPKIKQELTALVTMDEDTADDCIYALPRGQKHIKGPSARFADALISYWGNARSGAFITQVNREEKFVEAIGSFQDVERNVIRQRRVRRPIVSSRGQIYNTDMINMTGNAACVIAERNAILNGIPKSLWSGAYEQAFALVAGTTKTLGEKLDRATKAFALQGITMEQVLEKLGYQDLSKIVPDDIVTLRGMITALKTGEETVETMFGRGGSSHEKVANPLKDDAPAMRGATTATAGQADVEGVKSRDAGASNDSGASTAKSVSNPAETQQNNDPGASNSAPADRTDPISSGPAAGKAADEAPAESGPDAPAEEKTAQPAAAAKPAADLGGDKPFEDADGYMAFMRDRFDAATSKSAVTELWGATRVDRVNLLTTEQIDELTKDKEAKLKAIKLKEAK